MGWKSSITITKNEAIDLIIKRLSRKVFETKSNEELSKILECIGYGDDSQLEYYGYNFLIKDKDEKNN